MNTKIKFEDLGIMDYSTAWEYQENLMKNTIEIKMKNRKSPAEQIIETPNYFLFVEHPHIYTLGKSGDENNMLISTETLEKINASYVKTNRGGDITYHGYGQIVGYPVSGRNGRLAGCRETLCKENLCHGREGFSLGYHTWFCI